MKPTVMTPSRTVWIDSLGSMGAMVVPTISHWITWTIMRVWTIRRTMNRRFSIRLFATVPPD